MKTYGVLGYLCKHSLSPLLHNAAFKALGISAKFEIFETQDLAGFMARVKREKIAGFSVTMPFKAEILKFLDGISPDAEKIGAVNCVKGLTGFNTDWKGAMRALGEAVNPAGKRIYLIGAGGAAAAFLYGFRRKKANVTVFSRTPGKLGARPILELDKNFDILINASACGFKSGESCVPKEILGPGKVVMDIVYEPLETRLIKDAKAAGCETVTGEKMLLYQAAASFEIWTGRKAPVGAMEKALLFFS